MDTTAKEHFQRLVGRRIRLARDAAHMTQEQLSQRMELGDRQILSNIEAGKRKVSAEEIVSFSEVLHKTIEYFTDTFMLVGEGEFSWRTYAEPSLLDAFESKAGRWIATYRRIAEMRGGPESVLGHKLGLTHKSSYEESAEKGERLSSAWNLGDIPALKLAEAMEEKLRILVLFVDAPNSISGAACRLPNLDAVIVNRKESPGRRNFDLAHELFHILTWDTMPPDRYDLNPKGSKAKRVEQLAENFASALLMPSEVIIPLWEQLGTEDIHDWINKTAKHLRVSTKALRWRLKTIGCLTEDHDIRANALVQEDRGDEQEYIPALFSKKFMENVHWAIQGGHISVRRMADLLDCTIDDLEDILRSHGLEAPFDL